MQCKNFSCNRTIAEIDPKLLGDQSYKLKDYRKTC